MQMPNGPSLTQTVVPVTAGGPPPGAGDGLADGEDPAVAEAAGPGPGVAGGLGWPGGGHVAVVLVSGTPPLEVGAGAAGEVAELPVPPVGVPAWLEPGERPTGTALPGGSPPWLDAAPVPGVGAFACAAPMSPEPVVSGVWMILMETVDTSRKPITAADTTTTGTVLPAGWTRTMARALPNVVAIRLAISAAHSEMAGSSGLRPIRPCWRSRRSVAVR